MTPRTTRRCFLKRAALGGTALVIGTRRARAEVELPYTAKEISARLGISTAVYQKERLGPRHIAAVRAAGIRYIELTMIPERIDIHDRAQISEILSECKRQEVRVVSIHANLQLRYNHPDEQQRLAAAAHLLDEIRFAESVGAGIVVAHFGTNDQSRKTVTEMLEKTRDMRIRLTVENMRGGLKPYAAFVDRIGSDRFGMTVDIGHIRDADGVNPMVKKGRAGDVMAQGGRRIWHLHLHDTFRLETRPDHRAPMHPDGIIEWGEVFTAIKNIDYRGVFLFEDGRGENPEQWVRLAGEFPRNFVARYGR
ncbi:MAG: sugar phosphate isomerase/epimerase [Phycisphaerales bacterium]|nr:MAG: sugar phosphate isomerase/epimerase [Phycisphaerales bacterium]